MPAEPVIAIFDIGKTNKKLFLFNRAYRIVLEETERFAEIADEEGDPCEDLAALTHWITRSLDAILRRRDFDLRAVNFSAYGASLVLLNHQGQPLAPLYNYLKPYPPDLQQQLYDKYGGEAEFTRLTASPALGSLNAGLQLYRLKKENPAMFKSLHLALHLPQYASYLFTGKTYSDITSIGCHTALWNFSGHCYHEWVIREGIYPRLAPVFPSSQTLPFQRQGKDLLSGVGLHDSSAALIPYLLHAREPFVLLSTGTWSISLNPFNPSPLTVAELQQDCLCYMEYRGKPVKAARLFAGREHEEQTERIAAFFQIPASFYTGIPYDAVLSSGFEEELDRQEDSLLVPLRASGFEQRPMDHFSNAAEAYHRLMMDLVLAQVYSTRLVLKEGPVQHIFVDGGFAQNPVFMHLLARAFPAHRVCAASVSQASALGAALAIHHAWNDCALPGELVHTKLYPPA